MVPVVGAVAQPVKTPSPSSFLLTHPGGNRWFKCLGSCPLWRPGWSCWLLAWTWPSLRLLPTVEEWTNRHMTFLLFGLGPLILPTPNSPRQTGLQAPDNASDLAALAPLCKTHFAHNPKYHIATHSLGITVLFLLAGGLGAKPQTCMAL